MSKSVDDILASSDTGQNGNQSEAAIDAGQTENAPGHGDGTENYASSYPEPNLGGDPEFVQPEGAAEAALQPGQQASQPGSDPNNWTYAAYRDEKDKRRREEQRARVAEQQLADLQQQISGQAGVSGGHPDPEGYQRQEQVLSHKLREHEANVSLRLARSNHKEMFDEAYEELDNRARNGDPTAAQAARMVVDSPDPGEALVAWFQSEQVATELGHDPVAAQRRAEIMSEPGVEYYPTEQVQRPVMPTNLAAVRSVAPRKGPAWGGPAPISDIFDRRAAERRG